MWEEDEDVDKEGEEGEEEGREAEDEESEEIGGGVGRPLEVTEDREEETY